MDGKLGMELVLDGVMRAFCFVIVFRTIPTKQLGLDLGDTMGCSPLTAIATI